MFPIRDARGRVVGFGGRVMGAGEPKYLNSPETQVFHKGQELYGLYEARQAQRKLSRLLVVEGYMDVLALAQRGIHEVVATLGTATTGDHVRRLFRVVPELVFCFDGDRAGRAAGWRALQACLPEMRDGHQARFLFLPEGEDPDSLVRKEGAEAFARRIGASLALSDYLLEELRREAGTGNLDGRARLAELAKPIVRLLPGGVYRELLTDRLAQEVGLGRDRLAAAMGEAPAENKPSHAPRRAAGRQARLRPSLVRQAITLLVNFPELGSQLSVPPGLSRVRQKGVGLLIELMELTRQVPGLTPAALVERFRERPEGRHLHELLAAPQPLGPEAAGRELADSLQRILALEREERISELVSKAEAGGLTAAEKDEFRQLQRDIAGSIR
jgi:DNA primase